VKEPSACLRTVSTPPRPVNPVRPVGTSSATSAVWPNMSTAHFNPRPSHQIPPSLSPIKLPTNTRSKLPWQQARYGIPPPGLVPRTGTQTTSELLNRRRKRASTGRLELPWQHAVAPPAPPGSNLLLRKRKMEEDMMSGTQWQQVSTSYTPPGSHTQVAPQIIERSAQKTTPGLPGFDPYSLHIQTEPNSGSNLLLEKRSISDNDIGNSSLFEMKESEEEGIASYSEENAFKCGQCGKTFPQRSVLQIHVCPKAPYKPYHCGHCSRLFSDPNELRNHAIIHINEKPFKCGYCSRSFSGATTLNNHIRTHTGEKPFECSACGKTFSQASQLSRHERIPGDCIRQ
jgi:hypothetical protein